MKNGLVWVIVIVVVALGAWYFSMRQDQAELEQLETVPAPVEQEIVAPAPRFPVERVVTPEPEQEVDALETREPSEPLVPLPTLAESDEEVLTQAEALFPGADLAVALVPDYLLSRMVSTIDGLDAARLPQPMRPTQPVPGRFLVLEANDQSVISPANGERYRTYLDLVQAVDVDTIVPLYLRYYPLLQEAYLGLGYQDTYFNDRLIEILDLLLATPEPLGLVEVRQNEAVYEFVDPDLEALAVGQKAMLRLSPDDRRALREKLRQLRAALAGAGPAAVGE